ncbi:hypothetical protein CRUP_031248 [Coryphaenoides rupestris]|nr:hypothetical protein CRUP_031248 [Coryphaenoides rupestris]
MAATGRGDGQEVETAVDRKPAFPRPMTYDPLGPEMVYMRGCIRGTPSEHTPLHRQTTAPMMPLGNPSANGEAPYRFRVPQPGDMDEVMAAMVLTSLSSCAGLQKPAEPSWSADMECGGGGGAGCGGGAGGGGGAIAGGGELSDSGSSGFWSWDPSSVSPAPSPSVAEMDSSPDEGLHMDLEQGEELGSKKAKCVRGLYKCLWPGCSKVLTSSVGIKRHVRMVHLGGGSESQQEEDFYYTRLSSDTPDQLAPPPPVHATPLQPAQATPPQPSWTPCGSPPASDLPLPPFRRRAHSTCGTGRRAARRRSVARFTAWRGRNSGAPPADGRRPACASLTRGGGGGGSISPEPESPHPPTPDP